MPVDVIGVAPFPYETYAGEFEVLAYPPAPTEALYPIKSGLEVVQSDGIITTGHGYPSIVKATHVVSKWSRHRAWLIVSIIVWLGQRRPYRNGLLSVIAS